MSTKPSTIMKPALLAALLFSLFLLPGCSDSNVLSNGNFAFTIELVPVNEGTTDFECVVMDINQLLVRPLDPGAADLLGSDALNLGNGIGEVSFKPSTCTSRPTVSLPPIVLPSGEYLVEDLDIANFQLIEETGGTGDHGCFISLDPAELGILPAPLTVNVGANFPNKLTITLDVTALEAAALAFPGVCPDVFFNFNDIFQFE